MTFPCLWSYYNIVKVICQPLFKNLCQDFEERLLKAGWPLVPYLSLCNYNTTGAEKAQEIRMYKFQDLG